MLLALPGAAGAVFAGDSTAGVAVAVALIGTAAVLAVSLAFFAVGRSEDRARAEEMARRQPPAAPDPPPGEEHPARDRRRPLPPRRPG